MIMADVRIFFVTNRNYLPGDPNLFGGQFNPDGVAALRFGYAEFAAGGPSLTRTGIHVYPDVKGIAAQAVTIVNAANPEVTENQGGAGFLQDLKAAMGDDCSDTIVFIHGFNVTFLEALAAGARLAHELATVKGRPLNVVVLSWPSDGKAVPLMSYYSDREDARASGPAVARAYLKLLDFVTALPQNEYCSRNLHLLAHSMGNYVLRNGLQAIIAKEPTRLVRLFDEIILAAPDEDDDSFESDAKLRPLTRIGRRVTVYHNSRDRALLISDKTKSNPDRLGSDGPRMLDLLPKKIVLVDCSRVKQIGDTVSYHSYFINCPPVSADIRATLSGVETRQIKGREEIRPERVYRLK
jgi:esterase/lipase superfamily enzyme